MISEEDNPKNSSDSEDSTISTDIQPRPAPRLMPNKERKLQFWLAYLMNAKMVDGNAITFTTHHYRFR
jgi:hypothetical protein